MKQWRLALVWLVLVVASACEGDAVKSEDFIKVVGEIPHSALQSHLDTNSSSNAISSNAHRIVGGKRAPIQRVPYQAALIMGTNLQCGASLVSAAWALTAAHCVVDNRSVYSVRVGSENFKRGGQVHRVAMVVRHSAYNGATSENDIAMLRISGAFTINTAVQPVRLPQNTWSTPTTFTVSGWGTLIENGVNPTLRLRQVTVRKVNRDICRRLYRGRGSIGKRMLCAGTIGRDSCQGDSGGPLVSTGGVQYGIVSFGNGCGRQGYPGVYTDVAQYLPWIRHVMEMSIAG